MTVVVGIAGAASTNTSVNETDQKNTSVFNKIASILSLSDETAQKWLKNTSDNSTKIYEDIYNPETLLKQYNYPAFVFKRCNENVNFTDLIKNLKKDIKELKELAISRGDLSYMDDDSLSGWQKYLISADMDCYPYFDDRYPVTKMMSKKGNRALAIFNSVTTGSVLAYIVGNILYWKILEKIAANAAANAAQAVSNSNNAVSNSNDMSFVKIRFTKYTPKKYFHDQDKEDVDEFNVEEWIAMDSPEFRARWKSDAESLVSSVDLVDLVEQSEEVE